MNDVNFSRSRQQQVGNGSGMGVLNFPPLHRLLTSDDSLRSKVAEIARSRGNFEKSPGLGQRISDCVEDRVRKLCFMKKWKLEVGVNKRAISSSQAAGMETQPWIRQAPGTSHCECCLCISRFAKSPIGRSQEVLYSQEKAVEGVVAPISLSCATKSPSISVPTFQGHLQVDSALSKPPQFPPISSRLERQTLNHVRSASIVPASSTDTRALSQVTSLSPIGVSRENVTPTRKRLNFGSSPSEMNLKVAASSDRLPSPEDKRPRNPPNYELVPRLVRMKGGLSELVLYWRTGKTATPGLGPYPPGYKMIQKKGRLEFLSEYDSWSTTGNRWFETSSSKQALHRFRTTIRKVVAKSNGKCKENEIGEDKDWDEAVRLTLISEPKLDRKKVGR